MLGCCGCCPKTRYKRLVDNIFPTDPKDGLVKSSVDKLVFYTSSQPEKLDRIGDYLGQKLAGHVHRARWTHVEITVEAMDILLASCTPQSLNLFVESYLKVIQMLLESPEPQMQLLGTRSFTKYSDIREDTPSYHRRYDFFVSKFSSLAHDNHAELPVRSKMRLAGIAGLRGVIRKTVSDNLQVDIWDESHMYKIIPALLFNMQETSNNVTSPTDVTDSPSVALAAGSPTNAADETLRDLMAKARFGSIAKVIKPVIVHLDDHDLWVAHQNDDDLFAVDVFKLIMYSISSQHSYAVVQILMNHLDHVTLSARKGEISIEKSTHVRTGIATVLSNIVAITASESIGPIVLDIINSLLNHLRSSISNCLNANTITTDGEKEFQETVINALGEFANNLPDFQKIEIMMFIISKVPPSCNTTSFGAGGVPGGGSKTADSLLQGILLRSLLKVSTKYNTVNLNQALPAAFLKPLLNMSLAPDPSVRLTVQHIFHQLLDRHCNLAKVSKPITLASLPAIEAELAMRHDTLFMKKHGCEIISSIFENIQLINNSGENYNALYTTLALLVCEMLCDEVIIETFRLTFSMQTFASETNSSNPNLSEQHKAAIHALVAAILYLIAYLHSKDKSPLKPIPKFCEHVHDVILARQEKASWMLPESNRYFTISGRRPSLISGKDINEHFLFKIPLIIDILKQSGYDTTKLEIPLSSTAVDSGISRSISDLKSITLDDEGSNTSSPGLPRRNVAEDVTFESLRRILHEPSTLDAETREIRRQQIVETYRTTPFVELIAREEKKSHDFHDCLEDILRKLPSMTEMSPTSSNEPLDPESNSTSDKDQTKKDKDQKDNDQADETDYKIKTDNPLAEICSSKTSSKRPPLFALQFPDLFVY